MTWMLLLFGAVGVARPAPARRIVAAKSTFRFRPRHTIVAAVVAVVAVWAAGLQMAVVAAGMLAITLWAITVRRRETRKRWQAKEKEADAVRGIAAQVRAGVPAHQAALDYGSAVPELLAASTQINEATRPEDRLARLWQATTHFGLHVAPILEAHAHDTSEQIRARGELKALLAGPQSTAIILTLLPLAGIGLGASMGADPLGLLIHTGLGNILLLVGVGLLCAGMVWSNHIMTSAGGQP